MIKTRFLIAACFTLAAVPALAQSNSANEGSAATPDGAYATPMTSPAQSQNQQAQDQAQQAQDQAQEAQNQAQQAQTQAQLAQAQAQQAQGQAQQAQDQAQAQRQANSDPYNMPQNRDAYSAQSSEPPATQNSEASGNGQAPSDADSGTAADRTNPSSSP